MIHGFWRHPQLFDAAEEALADDRRLPRPARLRDPAASTSSAVAKSSSPMNGVR